MVGATGNKIFKRGTSKTIDMGFKIGQKVVCVEPSINLIKDEIYTIKGFTIGGIKLKELEPRTSYCQGFWSWRFEPLELDYDFVEEVIKQVKPQKQEA